MIFLLNTEIKTLRVLTQIKQCLCLYFKRTYKLCVRTWISIGIKLVLTIINKLNNRVKRHPNLFTLWTLFRKRFIYFRFELINFRYVDIGPIRKLITTLFKLSIYFIDKKYLKVLNTYKYRLGLDWNFE